MHYEEPDIERSQGDSDKEESAFLAPELVARTPSHPIFGARSGLLVDPEHVRIGRQTSLGSLRKRRVIIKEVPNIHFSAGALSWHRSQPIALDDVTQNVLAVHVFFFGIGRGGTPQTLE